MYSIVIMLLPQVKTWSVAEGGAGGGGVGMEKEGQGCREVVQGPH